MAPLARTITVFDENGTAALGAALAAALEPPAVIALRGTLGAGKTRFARALAGGLGVDEAQVSSPTFVLLHEYAGVWPVYHFDAYRIRGEEEFWQLGANEYFSEDFGEGFSPAGQSVAIVEWADRVAGCLPAEYLDIEIVVVGESMRRFNLTSHGDRYDRLLERIRWPANQAGE